jgi:hypothetical protein
MKNHSAIVFSAVLALVLAVLFAIRISAQRQDFDRTLQKTISTSVGYDKAFIGMVDRLENELATRASFGYEGGKDPMTGRMRQVVIMSKNPSPGVAPAEAASVNPVKADPVRLTAIIFDDRNKRYSAVVMDDERSYSVEVGDMVRNRTIREITQEAIIMEGDSLWYMYNVSGKTAIRRK